MAASMYDVTVTLPDGKEVKLRVNEDVCRQMMEDVNYARELALKTISTASVEPSIPTEESCGFQWPKARTIELISLYNEHREKFELPQYTNIQIWRIIANKLNEEGFSVTPAQVDTKWRGLKKTFKKIKLHNSQSGNNRKHWEFYSLMDDAIGKRPEISPVATCSNTDGVRVNPHSSSTPTPSSPSPVACTSSQSPVACTSSPSTQSPVPSSSNTNSRKRKRDSSELLNVLHDIRREIQERREERKKEREKLHKILDKILEKL
ncbi:uncharacterized protein [Centruroides vittatus]|uniref:uncharacterized protein n=1 Tax=Centruroides vittatus TaxID=120091 RepID=UPI00350F6C19